MKLGRSRFYTCIGWLVICLLYSFPYSTYAQTARTLRSGDTLTLPTSQSKRSVTRVRVHIQKVGEYTFQTLGETDTFCRLYKGAHGILRQDDDSGNARNCRLDVYLQPGMYTLHVRKNKRPVQVRLSMYTPQGAIEEISLGAQVVDFLQAKYFRAFRLHVRKQQWLDVQIGGATLHHCRLVDAKGWQHKPSFLTKPYNSVRRSKDQRNHIRNACRLSGVLSPGTYTLYTYGGRAPKLRGRYLTRAPLYIRYGIRKLQALRWTTLRSPFMKRKRWFFIPRSTNNPHQKATLVMHIRSPRGPKNARWFIRLIQRDTMGRLPTQSNSTSRYRGYRSQGLIHTCRLSKYHRKCTLLKKVEAGKRYELSAYSRRGRSIRVRYFTFFEQKSLSSNTRVRALTLAHTAPRYTFNIRKAGLYWLEAYPPTEGCIVRQFNRPIHKRTITARGFSLFPQQTKTLNLQLYKAGRILWFKVPRDGHVNIQSASKFDTFGALYSAQGQRIAYNDDSGPKMNFKLSQTLRAGYYGLYARMYRGKEGAWTSIHIQYSPKDKTYKTRPLPNTGCSFAQYLAPGSYQIRLSEYTRAMTTSFGVVSLPLQKGSLIRVQHGFQTQNIPVRVNSKYSYFKITHTRTCSLRQGSKLIRTGRRFGTRCIIRGRVPKGLYTLHLPSEGLRASTLTIASGRRSSAHFYKTSTHIAAVSKKPTPSIRPLQNDGTTWTQLAQSTSTWIPWKVKQAGVYRIESLGHARVSCAVQTKAHLLTHSPARSARSNCAMTRYFPEGNYRIQVQALAKTSGTVGIRAQRLNKTTPQAIRSKHRIYSYISKGQVLRLSTELLNKGSYTVQALSLDTTLRCALLTSTGVSLHNDSTCTFKIRASLPTQKYTLFIWSPLGKKARVRTLLAPSSQWSEHFIRTMQYPSRVDPRKPIRLLLNQSVRTHLSELGLDTYTWNIRQKTRLKIQLSAQMKARIYRGSTSFVSAVHLPQNAPSIERTLSPGTYTMFVRHRKNQTRSAYTLKTQILEVLPNTRIWMPLSSRVHVRIRRTQRIQFVTQGDHDVWCEVYKTSAQQIARNDDRSSKRWDCGLSTLLKKGRYTLHIRSHAKTSNSGVWLTIRKQPLVYSKDLQTGPKGWKKLPRNTLLAQVKSLKKPQLLTLTARAQKSAIRCVLEHGKGQIIQVRPSGTSCTLNQLVSAGTVRWRVRSASEVNARVKMNIISNTAAPFWVVNQPLKGVKKGFNTTLFWNTRPGFYSISSAAPNTLQSCALGITGTLPSKFACARPFYMTKGLWNLQFTTSSTGTADALFLRPQPLRSGLTQTVRVPAQKILRYPLWASKSGVYAVEIKSAQREYWGCSLDKQRHASTTQTARTRCRFVVQLRKGRHLLKVWRPQLQGTKTLAHARISMRRLSTPSETHIGTLHTFEGQLSATASRRWIFKAKRSLRIRISLRGAGYALLRGPSGRVQHLCVGRSEITSCIWETHTQQAGRELWITASKTLQYSVNVSENTAQKSSSVLRLTKSYLFPQKETAGTWTLWLRGPSIFPKVPAQLDIIGGQKQCIVWGKGPRFQMGCKHTMRLHLQLRKVEIRYTKIPKLAVLYVPKAYNVSLWGGFLPNSKKYTSISPIENQRLNLYSPKNPTVAWYKLHVPQQRIVYINGYKQSLTCALFNTQMRILDANVGSSGCSLFKVFSKGTYWLGVHQIHEKALRGFIQLRSLSAHIVTEGRHGPYLHAPGQVRWFRFQVQHNTHKVGLGAVAQHEEIQCALHDASGRRLHSGCQHYSKLKKGTYFFSVQLPKSSPSTVLHVVVRGLKRKKQGPPKSYFKKLTLRR